MGDARRRTCYEVSGSHTVHTVGLQESTVCACLYVCKTRNANELKFVAVKLLNFSQMFVLVCVKCDFLA